MINPSQKYPVLSPKANDSDGEEAPETRIRVEISAGRCSLPTRALSCLRLKPALRSPGHQEQKILCPRGFNRAGLLPSCSRPAHADQLQPCTEPGPPSPRSSSDGCGAELPAPLCTEQFFPPPFPLQQGNVLLRAAAVQCCRGRRGLSGGWGHVLPHCTELAES